MQITFGDSRAVAHVTPDGMQWLDPDGNIPEVDKQGHLLKPFILVTYEADGTTPRRKERWHPPAILPLTPAAIRAKPGASTKPVTDPDSGAESGNTQGGTVAVSIVPKAGTSKPAPKPSSSKGPSTRAKAVAAIKGKADAAPKPAANGGQPSKPANGQVYLRHMRTPRDAYILIKNPSVFGTESNWAVKDEFPTAAAAIAFAAKNGLKVLNPPKS